jgi:hypothetical protein
MMNFRVLKTNLESILTASAAGRYQVVGFQQQATSAIEVLGVNRRVQVFYGSGDFPKGKASTTSHTQHEITYNVELTVSAAAQGDLSVINDGGSTPPQIAAAIAAFQTASSKADESMDELFDIIYQILMDARNVDIGTTGPPFTVSNRWIGGMRKDNTIPQGEYVILTGNIEFTCQSVEEVVGDTGTPAGAGPFDSTIDIDGDDNEKTGVTE